MYVLYQTIMHAPIVVLYYFCLISGFNVHSDYVCIMDLGLFELSLFMSDGSERVSSVDSDDGVQITMGIFGLSFTFEKILTFVIFCPFPFLPK